MATSIIKGGIEQFDLTRNSSISAGEGKGVYDRSTGLVRITLMFNNGNTAIASQTILFTIPSAYRPREATNGQGVVWTGATSSPAMAGSNYPVNTEGGIRQNSSNNTTRGFGYIEYTI